jgi:hypothetical protein
MPVLVTASIGFDKFILQEDVWRDPKQRLSARAAQRRPALSWFILS